MLTANCAHLAAIRRGATIAGHGKDELANLEQRRARLADELNYIAQEIVIADQEGKDSSVQCNLAERGDAIARELAECIADAAVWRVLLIVNGA